MNSYIPYVGLKLRHIASGATVRVVQIGEGNPPDVFLAENDYLISRWVHKEDYSDFVEATQ